MTTWTEVNGEEVSFETPADSENGYVVKGYVRNGYLSGRVWSEVDDTSTTWE